MRFASSPKLSVVAAAVAVQNAPLPPTEPAPLTRWATPDGRYPQDGEQSTEPSGEAPAGEEAVGADLSELIVDAIRGVGFPTLATAIEAEQLGLAVFTGNQHNEHWVWVRDELRKLSEKQLQNIYVNLKIAQQHAG